MYIAVKGTIINQLVVLVTLKMALNPTNLVQINFDKLYFLLSQQDL